MQPPDHKPRAEQETMIRCGGCMVDHPASAFSPGKRKGGDYCREFSRTYNAARVKKKAQEYKEGALETAVEKACRRCERVLPASVFKPTATGGGGLHSYCAPCRAWAQREQRYGKTQAELEALLASQDGKCAGCARPISFDDPRTNVDHDHDTLAVRGILCGHCNSLLGYAKDEIRTLLRLVDYLSRHQSATRPATVAASSSTTNAPFAFVSPSPSNEPSDA